jgi:hypothetical protein
MRFTRGDWETAFADWVQSGCDPDNLINVGDEWFGMYRITEGLLGDTSIMSRLLCEDVGLEAGSTYDEGAREVRRWLAETGGV